MTREELIQVIHRSSDKAACPLQDCHKYKGIDGCWQCAEKQLAEYEKKIRAKAIDECMQIVKDYSCALVGKYYYNLFMYEMEQLKGE